MLTLKQVEAIKWYRQSGAGVPLCLGLPILSLAECMQTYCGLYFPNDISIYKKSDSGYLFYHYFDYYLTLQQSRKIFDLVENNFALFEKMKKGFYESAKESEEVGLSLLANGIEDQEFQKNYSKFIDLSVQFWINSLYLDLLDPIENEIINFIFDGREKDFSKEEINILFTPDKPSILQQEQFDLLKIAESDASNRQSMLEEHAKKYYFIKNDYEKTEFLKPEYFFDQLQNLLSNEQEIENLKKSQNRIEEVKRKKEELIERLSLNDQMVKRLEFFNWSTIFRDERKKYSQISCYIMLELIEQISKKYGIDMEILNFAMPKELEKIVAGDEQIISELGKRRERGVVIFADVPGKAEIVSGEEVDEYFSAIEDSIQASEIKGSVVSSGRVIGTVKVILNQNEFSKMNDGDVIVTSMTRPEFVPIMQKASAVITDEGGLTCHAAIVSRELGLPCITGTRIASKSLHDGDIVDVDAIHGIIKMVKEAPEGKLG